MEQNIFIEQFNGDKKAAEGKAKKEVKESRNREDVKMARAKKGNKIHSITILFFLSFMTFGFLVTSFFWSLCWSFKG